MPNYTFTTIDDAECNEFAAPGVDVMIDALDFHQACELFAEGEGIEGADGLGELIQAVSNDRAGGIAGLAIHEEGSSSSFRITKDGELEIKFKPSPQMEKWLEGCEGE